MPIDNRHFNLELLDAIINCANADITGNYATLKKFTALLENKTQPSNLLATIDKSPKAYGRKNLFLYLLYLNCESAIDEALKHTEKTGQIIDLSQTQLCGEIDPNNTRPMNVLHYAAIYCTRDILYLLIEYQKKHFPDQNIASIINRKFKIVDHEGVYRLETLGTALLQKLPLQALCTNLVFPGTEAEQAKHKTKFALWKTQELIAQTTNESSISSLITPPIRINLMGPIATIELLILEELDVNATNYKHDNLITLSQRLLDCSKNAKMWNENYIIPRQNSSFTAHEAFQNDPNTISFKIRIANTFSTSAFPNYTELANKISTSAEMQPRIFRTLSREHVRLSSRLSSDFSDFKAEMLLSQELVTAKLDRKQAALTAKVTREQTKLTARVTKVEESIQTIFAKLATYTEEKYNETCRNLSHHHFYLYLFQVLHQKIESYIRQRRDATLKVFVTNPSSEQLISAQAALSILNMAAGLCPAPFASIIPALVQKILDVGIQMDNSRKSQGVFDATLGMQPGHIATCVGSRIVASAMLAYSWKQSDGNPTPPSQSIQKNQDKIAAELFKHVKTQIDKMYKSKSLFVFKTKHPQEFVNPGHIIGFLCESVLKHLDKECKKLYQSAPPPGLFIAKSQSSITRRETVPNPPLKSILVRSSDQTSSQTVADAAPTIRRATTANTLEQTTLQQDLTRQTELKRNVGVEDISPPRPASAGAAQYIVGEDEKHPNAFKPPMEPKSLLKTHTRSASLTNTIKLGQSSESTETNEALKNLRLEKEALESTLKSIHKTVLSLEAERLQGKDNRLERLALMRQNKQILARIEAIDQKIKKILAEEETAQSKEIEKLQQQLEILKSEVDGNTPTRSASADGSNRGDFYPSERRPSRLTRHESRESLSSLGKSNPKSSYSTAEQTRKESGFRSITPEYERQSIRQDASTSQRQPRIIKPEAVTASSQTYGNGYLTSTRESLVSERERTSAYSTNAYPYPSREKLVADSNASQTRDNHTYSSYGAMQSSYAASPTQRTQTAYPMVSRESREETKPASRIATQKTTTSQTTDRPIEEDRPLSFAEARRKFEEREQKSKQERPPISSSRYNGSKS